MKLVIYYTDQEQIEYLKNRGYSIEYTTFDSKGRNIVLINDEPLHFHWNKIDFCKNDQVNYIFTQLIKQKLLEL